VCPFAPMPVWDLMGKQLCEEINALYPYPSFLAPVADGRDLMGLSLGGRQLP
jgi:hypothetical protein